MPLIANNIFVGGNLISPTKLAEPAKKEIKKEQPKYNEIKEEQPKYNEIKDGELHKLINTKSSYLSDMTGINK
jgi:hypothetical protein